MLRLGCLEELPLWLSELSSQKKLTGSDILVESCLIYKCLDVVVKKARRVFPSDFLNGLNADEQAWNINA